MSFTNKNFEYKVQPFGKFIDSITPPNRSMSYLRSTSSTKPAEKPTKLDEDFPMLYKDFQMPSELGYVEENIHSSPLRIGGPVNMWLHYDVRPIPSVLQTSSHFSCCACACRTFSIRFAICSQFNCVSNERKRSCPTSWRKSAGRKSSYSTNQPTYPTSAFLLAQQHPH